MEYVGLGHHAEFYRGLSFQKLILLADNSVITFLLTLILVQESLNWHRAANSGTVERGLLILESPWKLLISSHHFVGSLGFVRVSSGHIAIESRSYLRPSPSTFFRFRKRSNPLFVEAFLLLLSQSVGVFAEGSISLLGNSKHHTHRFGFSIFLGEDRVEAWDDYFPIAEVVIVLDLVDALWSLAHLVS